MHVRFPSVQRLSLIGFFLRNSSKIPRHDLIPQELRLTKIKELFSTMSMYCIRPSYKLHVFFIQRHIQLQEATFQVLLFVNDENPEVDTFLRNLCRNIQPNSRDFIIPYVEQRFPDRETMESSNFCNILL